MFIIRVAAIVCILASGLSCPSETVPLQRPGEPGAEAGGTLTLFITGSELGALKPCGCSGGQLGGLSKRSAIFGRVPAADRIIVDVGSLVADDAEQDLIKFRVLFEAFSLLHYDLVHLTRRDAEMARNLGLSFGQDRPFDVLYCEAPVDGTPWVRQWSRRARVGDREVAVRFAAFDAQTDAPDLASQLFSDQADRATVDIVVLQNDHAESRRQWSEASGVDCIICQSDSDEPLVLSEVSGGPRMFTVGRFGRYVGRLDVHFSEAGDEPILDFEDIAVEEALPEDPVLVRLYEQYQQIVAGSGLLESYPRIPLPDDLEYVGSENCKWCHMPEHAIWSEKAHADALATLEKVGSDRDPECVICHVVGMDRESGFVNMETTPHLKDVGCENCHGPGSEHVRSEGQTPTVEPKQSCLSCHTPDHSSGYAGHEVEYRQKITHWWEP